MAAVNCFQIVARKQTINTFLAGFPTGWGFSLWVCLDHSWNGAKEVITNIEMWG